MGGTFTSNGNHSINVNNNLPNGSVDGASGALIVGGDVAGAQSNVKGNVALAGNHIVTQPNPAQRRYLLDGGSSEFNLLNDGTTLTDVVDVPVADVAAAFVSMSTFWSGLSATGGTAYTGDTNNPVLTVGPAGLNGYAVVNLDAAEASFLLGGNPQIRFSGNTPITTIINVAGTSFDNARKNINGFTGANNVIFNFYEATNIAINSTFGASIFAPLADIAANAGGANAFMVGNNIVQKYEIRTPFTGSIPTPDPAPPPSPVPLPAAGWLLIGGLTGLVSVARRRRAA